MTDRETSQSIDAAAAAWVAREDRAPLSPADRGELEAWLAGDARRRGALLRARAVFMRTEQAAVLGAATDALPIAPTRRRLLSWGGGAAATVAIGGIAGFALSAPKAYATDRGEIRLTPLADGSTLLLNTQSRAKVRYSQEQRLVRLIEGEAYVTVLPDPRPFVLQVGDREINATAGAFRIRKLGAEPVDVLVQHGRLEVAGAGRRAILTSNTRLVLPPGLAPSTPQPVKADAMTRELSWRDGMIAFQGETLAQAAATFARYSDTKIVIDDPELAQAPITGLFAANDPVGFSRAVAGVFGAAAEVERGRVILSAGTAAE